MKSDGFCWRKAKASDGGIKVEGNKEEKELGSLKRQGTARSSGAAIGKGMHAAEKRQGEKSADSRERSRTKEGKRTNEHTTTAVINVSFT